MGSGMAAVEPGIDRLQATLDGVGVRVRVRVEGHGGVTVPPSAWTIFSVSQRIMPS